MALSDIVKTGFDLYNAHDADAFVGLYHHDASISSPMHPDGVDLAGHANNLRRVFAAFPDIHAEPEMLVCEEHKVVVEFHVTGTHLGTFEVLGGVHPPTGRSFSIKGTLVQEFDDRQLIISERGYWDTENLLRQLDIELVIELAGPTG
jgi:steroid delta-isomerase-like uncharacterized protein